MAIISGALWNHKSEQVDSFIKQLIINTKNRINSKYFQTKTFNNGFVVASLKDGEALTEQIIFQSTSCLVGRMFRRPAGNDFQDVDIDRLTDETPISIDDLKENYWGRYVGVSFNCHQPKVCLIRDPQGLATFYWTRFEEATLFSSDLTLLYDTLKKNLEINDEYFLKFILGKTQSSLLTPFKNIYEVPPGCELFLQPEFDPIVSSFWNPLPAEKTAIKKNFEATQVSQEIINRLKYVISCWTSGSLGICLNLSGGLDSSALLLLLSETILRNKKVLALNYKHSLINASDESEEAQKAADFCNIPLHVFDWTSCLPLSPISKKVRWERPYTELINQETFYSISNFIRNIDQYEFMDGQGGDHLFLMPPPFEAAVDYLFEKGIPGLHSIIKNLSHYYRQSFWSSYKEFFNILKKYYAPSFFNSFSSHSPPSWLNVPKGTLEKDRSHKWIPNFSTSLPGKNYHYHSLREASFYQGQAHQYGNNLILHPLLSQPLIEYILSLPTYLFFNKDYDRILFRQAMNDWKPNPFVWRKTKGETSGVIQLGLRQHFSRVCELCLEGYLARKGLIKKDLLYNELLALSYGKPIEIWPLLNVLACEIWFENWEFL